MVKSSKRFKQSNVHCDTKYHQFFNKIFQDVHNQVYSLQRTAHIKQKTVWMQTKPATASFNTLPLSLPGISPQCQKPCHQKNKNQKKSELLGKNKPEVTTSGNYINWQSYESMMAPKVHNNTKPKIYPKYFSKKHTKQKTTVMLTGPKKSCTNY